METRNWISTYVLLLHALLTENNSFLHFKEFKKGMRDYGCDITSDEAAEMFNAFDVDHSGHVSFDELLTALR